MRSVRFLLSFVLMQVSNVAFAQSDMHKATDKPVTSDAQKAFDQLKTLAGTWRGSLKATPPDPDIDGAKPEITLRVTSRGNALVHEMQESGKPLDATKYDHPVTMLYLEGDKLNLIHYCDAGNRPHMVARPSADGKKVEFDFSDLSGGNQFGHMYHAVFTVIDADHHAEDWTYMMPGDKPVQVHMDLLRAK
ncbi:MAG TPA: hypothetical protein VJN92_17515 [Candidatus Acidoferrum sp.]|nr:hypothetical protein [Candidatus Acidoferrum sp.]